MYILKYKKIFSERMLEEGKSKNTISDYIRFVNIFFSKSKELHPEHISKPYLDSFLDEITDLKIKRKYYSAIKKFYEICLIKNDLCFTDTAFTSNKAQIIFYQELNIKNNLIFDKSCFGKLNTKRIKRQKLKEKLCGT
jgi:hypothetical protein